MNDSQNRPESPTHAIDDTIQKFEENILHEIGDINQTNWLHILEAFAHTQSGNHLLQTKDIDTKNLLNDLKYIRIFETWNPTQKSTNYLEALRFETQEKFENIPEGFIQESGDECKHKSYTVQADFLSSILQDGDATPDTEINQTKIEILEKIKGFREKLACSQASHDLFQNISQCIQKEIITPFQDALPFQIAISEILSDFSHHIKSSRGQIEEESIGKLIDFLSTDRRLNQNNPIDRLKFIRNEFLRNSEIITSQTVFCRILLSLENQGKYLLHRNGLLASDDYTYPKEFPCNEDIVECLRAYKLCQEKRFPVLENHHFVLASFYDNHFVQAISDVTQTPIEEIWKLANEEFENEEETFRKKIKISGETLSLLKKRKKIKTNKDLVFSYLESGLKHPKIASILEKAKIKNKDIPKILEKVGKTLDKEKEEKPKISKKFDVSDQQLEENLKTYTTDLTAQARKPSTPPVLLRETEIQETLTSLLQKERSNAILLGEAGVGKTAVFLGVAQAIAKGQAPSYVSRARVLSVDLNLMNAGAMYRGQFEERLLTLIRGVAERNAANKNRLAFILCLDEFHNIISTGSASETQGAAEILKPYLTQGDLKIIAATTQREYASHVLKDRALSRRFSPIHVNEPDLEKTKKIIKERAKKLAEAHKLPFKKEEEKLSEILVELCAKFIPDLHQPDKSLITMDYALAITKAKNLNRLTLDTIQTAVASRSKIPKEFIALTDNEKFHKLGTDLPKIILGQKEATGKIAASILRARAGLGQENQPLGTYLLPGPTGVGKTQTAKTLAKLLFGSEKNLIALNMSDYSHEIEFTKLTGAPPGYVGHGEEGTLTGPVRKNPQGILLLDEFEKGHPSLARKLLPIFEEGKITDGLGQTIDFRGFIILITTNLGADTGDYFEAARQFFAPEFLGRMNEIIPFNPLGQETINSLTRLEIKNLLRKAEPRLGYTPTIDDSVSQHVAKNGTNPQTGARHLKKITLDLFGNPLSQLIMGPPQKSAHFTVELGEIILKKT